MYMYMYTTMYGPDLMGGHQSHPSRMGRKTLQKKHDFLSLGGQSFFGDTFLHYAFSFGWPTYDSSFCQPPKRLV